MISEKLYELAFEYKKAKLWKALWDAELFAIKLSGGRIGYVSVAGARGDYCALALYIGEEGIGNFRNIMEADSFSITSMEFQERLLMQKSLQCAFEGRDSFSSQEQEEAKQYARTHGIRISGKNAYPQFLKYEPFRCPWHIQDKQDQEDLCAALEAALEVARLLESKQPLELGIEPISDETEEVPMLVWEDGKFEWGSASLPQGKEMEWPEPEVTNDIAIANLKKIKKAGTWECELIRSPEPVQDDEDKNGAPIFPLVMLAVDSVTEYILPVSPVIHYEERPQELLNLFMEGLLMVKVCPKELKVRDLRTYGFVKSFCSRMKIKVSIEEGLPALDQAENAFFQRFGGGSSRAMDEAMEILNAILELEPKNLKDLPEELVGQLKLMVSQGLLPDDMAEKINRIFKFDTPKSSKITEFEPKANAASQSYVISVSLYPGCYRHIQISGGSTLEELHLAIQEAFSFDNDHAYAFFMDNAKWSRNDCYYAEGIEEGYRTANQYSLEQVGMEKGKRFKYIFDFGDEWTFQCKVLRVQEGGMQGAKVIKAVGDAPEQYPEGEG